MYSPRSLLARDVASMLLDLVPDAPCSDDGFACSLRQLVHYMVPLTLALGACVVLGFILAVGASLAWAHRERRRGVSRAERPAPRVVSGPVHTDGTWVRLVEDDHGRRMIEILDGDRWKPASGGLRQLAAEVPLAMRPPP
jgi:hypothetical protein